MPAPVHLDHNDVSAPDIRPVSGLIDALEYLMVTNGNWTKPYTGTNKAAFRMPVSAGGAYLQVDDSNAGYSELAGYLAMTDVDTGTDRFPPGSTLVHFRRYNASEGSDPGEWFGWASDKFLIMINKYGSSAEQTCGIAFGKPNLVYPEDAYGFALIGNANNLASTSSNTIASNVTGTGGHWCRGVDGTGSSIPIRRINGNALSYSWSSASANHPITGGAKSFASQVRLCDDSSYAIVRGTLPGMIAGAAQQPWTDQESLTLAAPFNGSEARFFHCYNGGGVLISSHPSLWN